MSTKGAIRINSLDASQMSAMEVHENRLDWIAAQRVVRDVPPLLYSPYSDDGDNSSPRSSVDDEEDELAKLLALIAEKGTKQQIAMTSAYDLHVQGAKRNKGAKKLALHAFVQFPTNMVVTPKSERLMLANAVQFVNRHHGGNAVFHARIDRDEAGRHGVDVFFAPRYEKNTNRKNVEWVSLTKFGKALACERFGKKQMKVKDASSNEWKDILDESGKPKMIWCDSSYYQGQALQDAFFEHLRDQMGLDWAKRGTKKMGRDPDRVEVEEYKLKQDKQNLKAYELRLNVREDDIESLSLETMRLHRDAKKTTEAVKNAVDVEVAKMIKEARTVSQIASEGFVDALERKDGTDRTVELLKQNSDPRGYPTRGGEQRHRFHKAVGELIADGLEILAMAPLGRNSSDKFEIFARVILGWLDDLNTAVPTWFSWGETVSEVARHAMQKFDWSSRPSTLGEIIEQSPAWQSISKGAIEEIASAQDIMVIIKKNSLNKKNEPTSQPKMF